jgi:hypothetical protein
MNNQFDELPKSLAQSVTRRAALKKFGVGLAGLGLAGLLAMPALCENPAPMTSTVLDAPGDAVFPYDLYGAPVPPYLDLVRASVSASRETFHFELQMNAAIPADADPGFTPSVNHLGPTFGLLTDPSTAESPIHFFGHNENYMFNYYLGALYSVADSGAGLGLGWRGFLIDLSTFTVVEIPLKIRKDTLILEVPAALLGNPKTINWAAAAECDPVTILDEKRKGALLVDFAPDQGYATWTAQ